jgi:hypothetical protein
VKSGQPAADGPDMVENAPAAEVAKGNGMKESRRRKVVRTVASVKRQRTIRQGDAVSRHDLSARSRRGPLFFCATRADVQRCQWNTHRIRRPSQ